MTRTDTPSAKAELRRHYRRLRRAIAADLRSEFDAGIRGHLAHGLVDRPLREIAAFLAFDGEPDLEPQLRDWHARGVDIALPVVPTDRSGNLSMHHWVPGADLSHNTLGIREPRVAGERPLAGLDVVLIPLVAFDAEGNRLGMGAGFYDRYLAGCAGAGAPLRVGVAYACQQAQRLPRDDWDVPLDAVVTERGWLSCPA